MSQKPKKILMMNNFTTCQFSKRNDCILNLLFRFLMKNNIMANFML